MTAPAKPWPPSTRVWHETARPSDGTPPASRWRRYAQSPPPLVGAVQSSTVPPSGLAAERADRLVGLRRQRRVDLARQAEALADVVGISPAAAATLPTATSAAAKTSATRHAAAADQAAPRRGLGRRSASIAVMSAFLPSG